jgi:hypothetical protein
LIELDARKEVVWMTEEAQEATESAESEGFSREYVEGLRGEAASWRTKLRETESQVEALNAKLRKFEDSQKSELERLTEEKARLEQEKDALEERYTRVAIDSAIKVAATTEGVIDPDAVAALIDRGEITYVDGMVGGVDRALKRLLKDKPYLKKEAEPAPPPSPGTGGQPLDGSDVNGVDGMFYQMLKGAKRT